MAREKGSNRNANSALGFEATLWASADTATRVSASRDCEATWRDSRAAKDDRSGTVDAAGECRSATSECQSVRKSKFDIRTLPDRVRDDVRWKFGAPPVGNINCAFRLIRNSTFGLRNWRRRAPTGVAGFILANGSMSSNHSDEGETCRIAVKASSLAA